MIAAPIASDRVCGRSFLISLITLIWFEYEMRLPLKMFSIVLRYWTGSERSKPHWCRIASSWVGETLWPPSRSAGSPLGITLKIRNVSTEIANRNTTIPRSRRAMKRGIAQCSRRTGARGVERVTYALAEDVQRQHGQHEHQPRDDRQVGGR